MNGTGNIFYWEKPCSIFHLFRWPDTQAAFTVQAMIRGRHAALVGVAEAAVVVAGVAKLKSARPSFA